MRGSEGILSAGDGIDGMGNLIILYHRLTGWGMIRAAGGATIAA